MWKQWTDEINLEILNGAKWETSEWVPDSYENRNQKLRNTLAQTLQSSTISTPVETYHTVH